MSAEFNTDEATRVMELLLQSNVDQLYAELAMREKAAEANPELEASFDPEFETDVPLMGPTDELRATGMAILDRWNESAYRLVCGHEGLKPEDATRLHEAFTINSAVAGAACTDVFIKHLDMAPILAIALAAIVVSRFYMPIHEEGCKRWHAAVTPKAP